MASGVTSQIREEFLVCQICLEDYDNPKALPCQHTFCQNCLTEMVATMGNLTCPNCRRECQLPQNGVDGLPTSFFVNKLRDIMREGSGAEPTRLCRCGDKSATTSHCLDCGEDLCSACTGSHRRPTANRAHKVVSKGDIPGPAQHTGPTPSEHSVQTTHITNPPVRVLLSSEGYEAIDDFFVRLCSTRHIHPDRVLPILSSLKEHDIMTTQDLHDNWDDVKDMVDMTKAMRQHIAEALVEFYEANPSS